MSRLLARLLTQSFPGKRTGVAEPAAAVVEKDSAAADTYTSRGLDLWLECLNGRDAVRILDLGVLRSANLSFCSAKGWDLGIVGHSSGSIVGHCEKFSFDRPFDAALCWDLPNFCDTEEEFSALGKWLCSALKPGSPVLVSLATRTPYDCAPAGYEILEDGQIRCTRGRGDTDRSVLFAQSRLGRLWPAFSSDRSFLLRSGWQEHVLHRHGNED